MNFLAGLDCGANYSERGPIACGGKGSCVAMREHSTGFGHQRSTVCSHGAIGCDVFGVDGLSFINEGLFDQRNGAAAYFLEAALHAPDGPKEIHGGGTRFSHDTADL